MFEKNLKALEKNHPKLAEQLRELPLSPDVTLFVAQTSNELNMAYKGVPLHDLQGPFSEAKALFYNSSAVEAQHYQSLMLVFGLGLGYLMKRVFVETKSYIIVFEPFLDVLRHTLEVVDFSAELASARLRVVTNPKELMAVISEFYLMGDSFDVLNLPAYEELSGELFVKVLTEVKSSLFSNVLKQNTALRMSEIATILSLANVNKLIRYPEISFVHNQFEGKSGVLVSAGPSLDRPGVIDTLKRYRDDLIIVSVGQAVKALDNEGIVPDFVVILETKDVTNQITGTTCLEDINLMLLAQTNPKVFELPTKRKMVSFCHNDPLTFWLGEAMGEEFYPYNHAGTVSISGLLLLFKLGCQNIFLLGQDLAYPEGKMYAQNSVYKNRRIIFKEDGNHTYEWENEDDFLAQDGIYKSKEDAQGYMRQMMEMLTHVKGWNGEKLITYPSYDAFRKSFEYLAANHSHLNLVNCSEGGAFIDGFEHLPFAQALEQYNVQGQGGHLLVEPFMQAHYQEREPNSDIYQQVYDKYAADLDVLKQVVEYAELAKEQVNMALKDIKTKKLLTDSVRSRMRKISYYDDLLSEMTAENLLINPFIQAEIFTYNKTYERKIQFEDEEMMAGDVDAVVENLETTELLYNAVIKGCSHLMATLNFAFQVFPAPNRYLGANVPGTPTADEATPLASTANGG